MKEVKNNIKQKFQMKFIQYESKSNVKAQKNKQTSSELLKVEKLELVDSKPCLLHLQVNSRVNW